MPEKPVEAYDLVEEKRPGELFIPVVWFVRRTTTYGTNVPHISYMCGDGYFTADKQKACAFVHKDGAMAVFERCHGFQTLKEDGKPVFSNRQPYDKTPYFYREN